jgi:DUF1680 family protein
VFALTAHADSSDGKRAAYVVDTTLSPHARLHPVPISAVTMGEGFWKPRLEANRTKAIPRLLELLEEHGVVDNFRRLSGRKQCKRRGPLFTDSDLYKWMEAAAWTLAASDDAAVRASLDRIIDEVLAAQCDDGYLNTYFVDERADKRWSDLGRAHELYCAGHLFQAAVAHYRATGSDVLLDGAKRYADYIASEFGPGRRQGAPGHPEIEMALVELYRTTGETRYLELCRFFQDQMKWTELRSLRGHAVRALYACAGGADYLMETGDAAYRTALDAIWTDLTTRKMYITGGAGARHHGEAFGDPFELPNDTAYAETCASIANAMWNWRMLLATGEARYADVMERVLYNGFLSGVSLAGTEYFYVNPLQSDGGHQRQPWYGCTCCPPNVQRTFACLPGYLYSTSPEGLWIHLYDDNVLDWRLEDGTQVRVSIETDYPWGGRVHLAVSPEKTAEFTLFLRIPAWCGEATVRVGGAETTCKAGAYHAIRRAWKAGDDVGLTLAVAAAPVVCDPRVTANRGRVAIARGPLVYCLESVGNEGVNIMTAGLPVGASIESMYQPDLLGGVVELTFDGRWLAYDSQEALYRRVGQTDEPASQQGRIRAVPYYAWANRGDSKMIVWIPLLP